jgi:hypothetical protein
VQLAKAIHVLILSRIRRMTGFSLMGHGLESQLAATEGADIV